MSDWITDRLPTAKDADQDGDVRIPLRSGSSFGDGGEWVHYTLVLPGQAWWTATAEHAAPAPATESAPARVVTALAVDDLRLFATCNDGTIWFNAPFTEGQWIQLPSIPQPSSD